LESSVLGRCVLARLEVQHDPVQGSVHFMAERLENHTLNPVEDPFLDDQLLRRNVFEGDESTLLSVPRDDG